MSRQFTEQEYITAIRAVAMANDWSFVNRYADGDLLELLSECDFKMALLVKSLQVLNDSEKLANH